MQKLCVLLATLTILLITGCSKDSSPTNPGDQPPTAPTVPTASFKGPQTNSTDANADLAKGYAGMMNALMSPAAAFGSQTAVNAGNTYTWTYTYQTLTQTFTATPQDRTMRRARSSARRPGYRDRRPIPRQSARTPP